MTDTPLTYQSDETAAKADFTITQEFTRENIELKTVYTNAYSNDDILNLNVKTDAATGNVITPNVADVHRVRIGYTKVSDAGTFEIKLNDGTTIAAAAVNDSNYQPGDDEAAFNAATGEILLGENVYKQLYASDGFSFTYRKDNFAKGDLNPVMYYDCVDNNPDNAGVVYTKKTEDIEYNINFSQKLKVNTEANEVFNMYLGRDIDDLITSVNNVIDIEAQLEKVEGMLKQDIYSDKDSQSKLNSIKEGLTKQNELAKEEMKNRFEYCVGTMQGYQEQASLAKADAGNRMTRLNLTKSRLTEQKTNFTNLKSENEDIDLEDQQQDADESKGHNSGHIAEANPLEQQYRENRNHAANAAAYHGDQIHGTQYGATVIGGSRFCNHHANIVQGNPPAAQIQAVENTHQIGRRSLPCGNIEADEAAHSQSTANADDGLSAQLVAYEACANDQCGIQEGIDQQCFVDGFGGHAKVRHNGFGEAGDGGAAQRECGTDHGKPKQLLVLEQMTQRMEHAGFVLLNLCLLRFLLFPGQFFHFGVTQFIGGLQIRDPLIQEGFGLPGNHQREDGNSDGDQSRQEIHTSPQRCVGAHDGTSQHGDQNDA